MNTPPKTAMAVFSDYRFVESTLDLETRVAIADLLAKAMTDDQRGIVHTAKKWFVQLTIEGGASETVSE